MLSTQRQSTTGQIYTPEQVAAVLRSLKISIESNTGNDYLCMCPMHGNRNTPSFTVGTTNGKFLCFNPACQEHGNLLQLVMRLSERTPMEAARFIAKKGSETQKSLDEELEESFRISTDEFVAFPQETLDRLRDDLWPDSRGLEYMRGRGFEDDTLKHFEIGYSEMNEMVTVPVHSPDGLPVGLVGRSIVDKTFKNSKNLPRKRTFFNLHRVKKMGGTAIIVESSFDAMLVHQAGYPQAIASLGGHLSPEGYALLDRYFSRIIIMTDYDDKEQHKYRQCKKCFPNTCEGHNPGRDLGYAIAEGLRNKDVLWAHYDSGTIYPHGAKDAGDMTGEEIRQCIQNAVTHMEYLDLWT